MAANVNSHIFHVRNLVKVFEGREHNQVIALSNLTFSIELGSFATFIGPSGCGKTTLLKCLGGLTSSTQGELLCNGRVVDGPPDGVAVVFQDYVKALLPWRTVYKNVLLPLEVSLRDKRLAQERAEAALKSVGLMDYKNYYPAQLSGGMQQRVQIARALAYRPSVLLLDEPFGSLDALTRIEMQDELLRLWEKFDMTIVMVSHDIDEAIYLSDRVVVLSRHGQIMEDIRIELPRPRNQVDTKLLPDFGSYHKKLYGVLGIASVGKDETITFHS